MCGGKRKKVEPRVRPIPVEPPPPDAPPPAEKIVHFLSSKRDSSSAPSDHIMSKFKTDKAATVESVSREPLTADLDKLEKKMRLSTAKGTPAVTLPNVERLKEVGSPDTTSSSHQQKVKEDDNNADLTDLLGNLRKRQIALATQLDKVKTVTSKTTDEGDDQAERFKALASQYLKVSDKINDTFPKVGAGNFAQKKKKSVSLDVEKISDRKEKSTERKDPSSKSAGTPKMSTEEHQRAMMADPLIATGIPERTAHEHRTTLPHPMSTKVITMWTLIKEALCNKEGWLKLSLPIDMMEPLSVLQCLCEELEYAELLNSAATEQNKYKRAAFIAAFAISRYACSAYRCLKKPFNSLEGETYEYVDHDKGWWFFGEHVNHSPVITACLARGRGWTFWQTSHYHMSLGITSIDVEPKTPAFVSLTDFNERYEWRKIKSSVSNLLSPNKRVDHYGEMKIACGNKCVAKVKFKKGTRIISGHVFDENNSIVYKLEGSWDKYLNVIVNTTDERLWNLNPLPPDYQKYYGYSYFALTLNEIYGDMTERLPPTDSRRRPDKILMEEGNLGPCVQMKPRIERQNRLRRETRKRYQPKWFSMTLPENKSQLPKYVYLGTYWTRRAQHFKGESFEELW